MILAYLIFPWIGKHSWAAAALLAGSLGLCSMGLLEAYVRSPSCATNCRGSSTAAGPPRFLTATARSRCRGPKTAGRET